MIGPLLVMPSSFSTYSCQVVWPSFPQSRFVYRLVNQMIKLVHHLPNTTGQFTGLLYGGLVESNVRLHVL